MTKHVISLVAAMPGLALWLSGCGSVNPARLQPITPVNAAQVIELAILPERTDWIHAIALSADGHTLLVGSEDATVRLWNARNGTERKVLRAHTGAVVALAFTPDGSQIVSAGVDPNVLFWDARTGRGESVLENPISSVNAMLLTPDSRTLVLGTGSTLGGPPTNAVQLWDVASLTQLDMVADLSDSVQAMAVSPDGSLLATSLLNGDVLLWSMGGGSLEPAGTLIGHSDNVRAIAFSPDGSQLVTGDNQGIMRFWDVASREELRVLDDAHANWIMDVAFSPDGSLLASGGRDGSLRLWYAASGQLLLDHPVEMVVEEAHDTSPNWVTAILFNPDGTLIYIGVGHLGYSTVRLYGVSN